MFLGFGFWIVGYSRLLCDFWVGIWEGDQKSFWLPDFFGGKTIKHFKKNRSKEVKNLTKKWGKFGFGEGGMRSFLG